MSQRAGCLAKAGERRAEKLRLHGFRTLALTRDASDYTGTIVVEYNFSRGVLRRMVVVEGRRLVHDDK